MLDVGFEVDRQPTRNMSACLFQHDPAGEHSGPVCCCIPQTKGARGTGRDLNLSGS